MSRLVAVEVMRARAKLREDESCESAERDLAQLQREIAAAQLAETQWLEASRASAIARDEATQCHECGSYDVHAFTCDQRPCTACDEAPCICPREFGAEVGE